MTTATVGKIAAWGVSYDVDTRKPSESLITASLSSSAVKRDLSGHRVVLAGLTPFWYLCVICIFASVYYLITIALQKLATILRWIN